MKHGRHEQLQARLQTTAEILVVGNELLNGTTLDTNSYWMSKELLKLGVRLTRKTTVRDELSTISAAFGECIFRKPDWLFSIGGLGPTYDDMTVEGLAKATKKKLYLDVEAVKMLKENYARRRRELGITGRRLSKASLKMAMIPKTAKLLRNSVGSAPGILVRSGPTRIAALPGVPSEMKAIFKENLMPMIEQETRQNYINVEEWLELVGVSESSLSSSVSKISNEYSPLIYVKSHPVGFKGSRSVIRIQLILTSTREDAKEALQKLHNAAVMMQNAARRLGANVKRLKSVR